MIQRLILGVLILLAFWGGCLPLVEMVASMGVSYFFCDISPEEAYSWYSGIWHGIFFLPNWMWNGINGDILYKANLYTSAYNFWWWCFSVITTIFVVWLYNIPKFIKLSINAIIERFR